MKLCSKEKCTGCLACYNVCSVNAIKSSTDKLGFIEPIIDEELCIDCNMCSKVCPELNNETVYNKSKKVFAAKAKNLNIRKKSTSGGVATELSKKSLEKGWIVYGAAICDNLEVKHIKIKNEDELYKIQGSKYAQSYIAKSYQEIKSDLQKNRSVLFIGTPCQVSGLLSYLRKKYDNLITMSFICGGVPTVKFLEEEIMGKIGVKAIDNILFRNNNEYGLRVEKNKVNIYEADRWSSEYFIGFDEGITLREGCYSCNYAKVERVGDITIGDFWGLKNSQIFNEREKEKGVSLVLLTTAVGKKFFEEYGKDVIKEEHAIEEACLENPRLHSVKERKKEVDVFREKYIKYGFTKSINQMYGVKYRIYKIKSFLKKNKFLFTIYRNLQKLMGIKK